MNHTIKFIFLLCFLYSTNMYAQWNIVKSSSIVFKIKNAGFNVDGHFKMATITAKVDDANIENSFFQGIVQANSINTGINLRDTHLKEKSDFFDVDKYPTITMKSINVSQKSKGVYDVTWDLTIKDITRRFHSDVFAKVVNNLLILNTEVKINRNDWKVGGNSLTMNDIVTVKLSASLSK